MNNVPTDMIMCGQICGYVYRCCVYYVSIIYFTNRRIQKRITEIFFSNLSGSDIVLLHSPLLLFFSL